MARFIDGPLDGDDFPGYHAPKVVVPVTCLSPCTATFGVMYHADPEDRSRYGYAGVRERDNTPHVRRQLRRQGWKVF